MTEKNFDEFENLEVKENEAVQAEDAMNATEAQGAESLDQVDQVDELDSAVELNELEEVEELKIQNEELEDQVLRLQAEIANMRRSHTRERQDLAKFRSQSLATSLLDVIDNLERALTTETTSEDGQAMKKGVEMVYDQFIRAFDSEQIVMMDPLHEEFDPQYHQAVTTAPADEENPDNTIVQVLQKGYRIDSRVIRPAMVIVAQD